MEARVLLNWCMFSVYLLCYFATADGGISRKRLIETNDLDESDGRQNVQRQSRGQYIDPDQSWMAFVRHSNRVNKKRQKKKNRDKKRPLLGAVGPPGPRGPPGPAGPPGAQITQEILMAQFKQMVKEEAERRAERLLAERIAVNGSTDREPLIWVPRVTAGFHHRLKTNVLVHPKTFLELKNFQMPFAGGGLQRGKSFNPEEGRFTAPRTGVYQFSVNLHVAKKKIKKKRKLRRTDRVRVLVCIQSLCQKFMSLETVSGLESNSRVFTVSVTGILSLQEDQYTSVYVDNASQVPLTIQSGSDFSAYLVGT